MANDFYSKSGNPATRAQGSSATIRNEFLIVEQGFDKLPTLTGNGLKLVRINSGATALEAVSNIAANIVNTPAGNIAAVDVQSALNELDEEHYNPNYLINGKFGIWQRGTSLTAGTGKRYLADRFFTDSTGSTVAPSRQTFTLGQTDVVGNPTYFHESVVASSAGAGNYAKQVHRIEGVSQFSGQTVTLSFYGKADASKNIAIEFVQNFGTGGSPSAEVTAIGVTTKALTTSWQKHTVTVTLPSVSTKTLGSNSDDYLSVGIWFDAGSSFNSRTNSLGQQSGTFDIAMMKLESGSVATPFYDKNIGNDFSLCQRYYQESTVLGNADTSSSTFAGGSWLMPVEMRASPTLTYEDDVGNASKLTLNSVNNIAISSGSITATSSRIQCNALMASSFVNWFRFSYTLDAEL